MNRIYWEIAILTLYGDLIKRYLPSSFTLFILYGLAFIILVRIVSVNAGNKNPLLPANQTSGWLSACICFLIFIYFFQFSLVSFSVYNVSVINGIIGVLYISTPLLYSVIIIHFSPNFELSKFSKVFHLLMFPINLVGWIQYFINPNFFISTSYSATGGVIARDLLNGGVFLRFPSIFASADRYSSIGLMQFYFAFMLLLAPGEKTRKDFIWTFFNIACSLLALTIAGARSRVLIALAIGIIYGVILLLSSLRRLPTQHKPLINKRKKFPVLTYTIMCLFILFAYKPELLNPVMNFPLVDFLLESLKEGDIQARTYETYQDSLVFEKISWLGNGIGYLGGKPGEMGIQSIWVENGLIWGFLILNAFGAIVLILGWRTIQSCLKLQALEVVSFGLPALALILGLLSGLTAVLELSSGILLSISMGAVIQYSSFARLKSN